MFTPSNARWGPDHRLVRAGLLARCGSVTGIECSTTRVAVSPLPESMAWCKAWPLRWISSHGARITAVERVVYLGSIGLNPENTPAIAIGQGIPSDGGWIDKLTIHESQSIGKPLFHVVDLTLICPSVGATRSLIPTLKVAYWASAARLPWNPSQHA